MADTPLHTLIMAARAEGGDEIADAAEAQLRGLMERDAEAQVAALLQDYSAPGDLAVVTCALSHLGTAWTVTLWTRWAACPSSQGRAPTLSAAIAAVRAAAQPVRAQADE